MDGSKHSDGLANADCDPIDRTTDKVTAEEKPENFIFEYLLVQESKGLDQESMERSGCELRGVGVVSKGASLLERLSLFTFDL